MKMAGVSTKLTMHLQLKAADAPLEATERLGRVACDALPWKDSTAAFQIKQCPSFGRDIMEIIHCCRIAGGDRRRVKPSRRALSDRGPVLEEGISCAQQRKMNVTQGALALNAAPCFTWKTTYAAGAQTRPPQTPF